MQESNSTQAASQEVLSRMARKARECYQNARECLARGEEVRAIAYFYQAGNLCQRFRVSISGESVASLFAKSFNLIYKRALRAGKEEGRDGYGSELIKGKEVLYALAEVDSRNPQWAFIKGNLAGYQGERFEQVRQWRIAASLTGGDQSYRAAARRALKQLTEEHVQASWQVLPLNHSNLGA